MLTFTFTHTEEDMGAGFFGRDTSRFPSNDEAEIGVFSRAEGTKWKDIKRQEGEEWRSYDEEFFR
jgi:hypothetical protein